jgi:hypothetical protein
MLRLIQAGMIAACVQCMIIFLLTLLIIFIVLYRIYNPQSSNSNADILSITTLLQWLYLLTAVGLALTTNRFVNLTGARIRSASRAMKPSDPDGAANNLLGWLWFTAFGFAALTLGPPPSFITELGWTMGYFDAAPIIWSAIMSVGVAGFGANAQAAAQAH